MNAMAPVMPRAALGDGSFGFELKLGLMIVALFGAGLLGWAAFVPLDAGATAEGVVAVSGHRQAVQHREGGIVTNLRVAEGSIVRQGEELLRVSASEVVAVERGLTGEFAAALALRQRLIAELTHVDHVGEPVEFASLPPADRSIADAALAGQRQVFSVRRAAVMTEHGVLGQRIRQLEQQIGGFRAEMVANQEQQRLIGDELSGLRTLEAKGLVTLSRLRGMERAASELTGARGAKVADIARSSEAIGEARLQMVSLDRKTAEENARELRDVQLKLDQVRPKLLAVREQIARSVIRAPVAGRVVGLKVFTKGGVIAPGDLLMEIVPDHRALVIDGRVSPLFADDLHPGMAATIRFVSLQGRNVPVLDGTVTKLSADGLEDERTGARYFRVEVRVEPAELAKLRTSVAGSGLRAGLPVSILIPLRKRSALTYLLEPLSNALWAAGRES
jgi:HlyD family secretion protein